MYTSILRFFEIAVFFLGLSFLFAYLIHRILFIANSKKLARYFPEAVNLCIALITEFADILSKATKDEIERFLEQTISRKRIDLPKQFRKLPVEVIPSVFSKVQKVNLNGNLKDQEIFDKIRNDVYTQYFQKYRHRNLNESLNWLLISIPFAFTIGIILPLIIYFYFPLVLKNWPLLLTACGIVLLGLFIFLLVRDYFYQE